MNLLTPQQIAEALQAAAGAGFVSARCTEWAEGVQGRKSRQVWLRIARESLIPTLQRLVEIHYPHVAVIASADTGAQVELMYHFYVYWGIPHEEILVTLTVALDKTDLKVPTITGIIELVMRVGAAIVLGAAFGFVGVVWGNPLAWVGAVRVVIGHPPSSGLQHARRRVTGSPAIRRSAGGAPTCRGGGSGAAPRCRPGCGSPRTRR